VGEEAEWALSMENAQPELQIFSSIYKMMATMMKIVMLIIE
jgi:hypothetical protein